MKNIKEYTFNISKYTGYRFRVEQSNLKCFRKLEYDGLKILYYSDTSMDFDVDLLLSRKLKLKQLNNEIKRNSTEDYILQLIERSQEREEDNYNGYWYTSTSGSNGSSEEFFFSKEEEKQRKKYQEKIFNQKIKQYENKGWIRK